MPWIEEESNIKFVDWGKLKPEHTKNDAVVFEVGKSYDAIITRITIVEKTDKSGDVTNHYKYRLKMKGEEKEILMWSNAAIKRQQETFDLQEGEHIEMTYAGDYDTPYGKKGRDVKIRVEREK